MDLILAGGELSVKLSGEWSTFPITSRSPQLKARRQNAVLWVRAALCVYRLQANISFQQASLSTPNIRTPLIG